MKPSAVATGKRRSMLPAPKSSGSGGASVAVSKTGEVAARRNKEAAVSSPAEPSDVQVQPAGLKAEISSNTVGNSRNVSESSATATVGRLAASSAGTVPSECHSGNESRQTQLRRASQLQRPVANQKRPSSASSGLNRVAGDLNRSSLLTKTSLDSDSSVKLTSRKGVAASADQNAEAKHRRLFRGTGSVSGSRSARSSTKPHHSAETTVPKLRAPAKYVTDGALVVKSCSAEIVSEIGSSHSQAETLLNVGPVISASVVTEFLAPEDAAVGTAYVLLECSSNNSVEGGFNTDMEQGGGERSESLSSGAAVADVPDVLSRVTSLDQGNENGEHLELSTGSLGILDDIDLLDTSLLSFDSSSALLTADVTKVEAYYGQADNPPGEDTLSAIELCTKQSSSASEIDPLRRTDSNEVSTLRPLSLMSNSSTDTGIVADCTVHISESRSQQERPSSYMSTSSADTGMC